MKNLVYRSKNLFFSKKVSSNLINLVFRVEKPGLSNLIGNIFDKPSLSAEKPGFSIEKPSLSKM